MSAARDADAAPGPVVRAAVAGDLAAIHAIETRAFSDPWSRQSFATLLRQPGVWFRVLEADGAVVGYTVAWFVLGEGELANIAVAPEARGRGFGAILLDAVLEQAARQVCHAVFLEVRDSNAPARGLYASRGFEEVGRRPRYYRRPVEDALVLRRELPGGDAREGG